MQIALYCTQQVLPVLMRYQVSNEIFSWHMIYYGKIYYIFSMCGAWDISLWFGQCAKSETHPHKVHEVVNS